MGLYDDKYGASGRTNNLYLPYGRCLVGIVNGIAISYLKVPAFVATLATQSIGRGLTEIISGGVTIRVRDDSYTAIGNTSIGGISVIIIYAAVILVFTWFLLNRTRFGYYIYAIGGNKLAAQYSGVNVKNIICFRMFLLVFSVAQWIDLVSKTGKCSCNSGKWI